MAQDRPTEVVVVGGGLVGSLLATLLVERRHAVTVLERRPDMRRSVEGGAGRSINLVLTRRGIRALSRVGLDRGALELTVPVTGRMMHALDGELAYQPYGRDDTECNYSIPRAALNRYLIEQAERRGVRFQFSSRLTGADLEAGRLELADEASDEARVVEADVVFGTDGAGSALRAAFAGHSGFEQSVDRIEYGYKELEIPAGPDGSFVIEPRALHIWPRGELMLMALPNSDGSFTVTLYLPYAGRHGFDALDTAEAVRALFVEQFADAVPLLPDLEEHFFANPVGSLGTVRCRPWHHGSRALLLGDAAHAIVPFFGQGMNSGFEDCTLLSELMDARLEHGWGAVFEAMSELRKPDADAIADMALENFVEMRDLVGDAGFLLRKGVEHRLEREFPTEYRSRYSMVMYSHIPFSTAFLAGEIQRSILDELCAGLDSAEALDVGRARELVRTRLTPFLAERGVALDY